MAGQDVHGWRHSLHADAVRHIAERHGPGSADRNPVTANDFRALPQILAKGKVKAGGLTRRLQLRTMIVEHVVRGTAYRVGLTVHPRRRALRVLTFSKEG